MVRQAQRAPCAFRSAKRSKGSSRPSLSKLLRRATPTAQGLVESTRIARALQRGSLTREAYAEGLAHLYPVYATLESALSSVARSDRLDAFDLPVVFRAQAILADLRYFGVAPEPIRPGASASYFARLQLLADEMPARLIAHAYVRYMADISGGWLAGVIAQRALKLPSRDGLAFLTFPPIFDPHAFREDFRRRLDAFPRDEAETSAIVAEASIAIELNRKLATEHWEELFPK